MESSAYKVPYIKSKLLSCKEAPIVDISILKGVFGNFALLLLPGGSEAFAISSASFLAIF